MFDGREARDRVVVLEQPLFLACTRPALWFGVPIEAAALCLMSGQLVALALGKMVYMPIAAGVFGTVARLVSRHDPLIFRVLMAWGNTRPQHPDLGRASRRWWGGISLSPLRRARFYSIKDFGRHV